MKNDIVLFLFIKDITLGGGAERVVVNMANEFAEIYGRVHIISKYRKNPEIKYALNPLVMVHYLKPKSKYDTWRWQDNPVTRLMGTWIYSLGFTRNMYRIVEEYTQPQDTAVILLNSYEIPLYHKRHTVLVGVDHCSFPYMVDAYRRQSWLRQIYSYFERLLPWNIDIVTCLTDAQLNEWKSLNRPVYVMPNFVGEIPYRIPTYASRKKIILSMGRMWDDIKGFDRLINIFSKVVAQFPDWKLRILGEGVLKEEYEKMIDEKDLRAYVEILDFTQNPLYEYQMASIYAVCSRFEGFSMVLAEAMVNGLPAIFYKTFGPNSIIKDSVTGYLVSNGDEKSYCERLIQMMEDCDLREQMGKDAREDIISRFSPSVVVKRWIDLFDKI